MKTLFLLRHAKSSWSDPHLDDFDRPLNERGLRTAPLIGKIMRSRGYTPGIIISSPAARAKHTAVLVAEILGLIDLLRFDGQIYESSPGTLLNITNSIDDLHDAALLVGHNPGMEGLTRLVTGSIEPMPTAALAVIDLEVDSWIDVGSKAGRLRELIRPKDELKGSSK